MSKLDLSGVTPACLDAMRATGQLGTMERDVNAMQCFNRQRLYFARSRWVGQLWHVTVHSRLPIEGVTQTTDGLYFVRRH